MHGHYSSCINYFNNLFSLLRLTLISTLSFSFHITALTFVLISYHQGTQEHRNRNHYRSCQRQHSDTGFRSKRGNSAGELKRVALLLSQEHHAHHRWERGHDLDGPRADLAATSNYVKCPECPQLGG